MAYIQGEVRGQQALFPSTLDELIPPDHVCRVIEAWRDMIRDERRHADAEVHVESVTQFHGKNDSWSKKLTPAVQRTNRVLVGPIAAGSAVIKSRQSAIVRLLGANYSDALAVEMEGSGFLRAAWRENNTKAVVIRGISDLLVGKEQTDRASWQIIAAKHAAAFAFKLLTHYGKPQAAEVVVKPSDSSRGVRGLPSPDAELLTETGSAANGTAHEQVKVERTRFDPELFKKLEGFAFASDGMDLPSKEASRKWAMERVRTWQTVDLESFVARFKELRKFAFSTSGLDLPSREAACIWAYKETCAEFGIE